MHENMLFSQRMYVGLHQLMHFEITHAKITAMDGGQRWRLGHLLRIPASECALGR